MEKKRKKEKFERIHRGALVTTHKIIDTAC